MIEDFKRMKWLPLTAGTLLCVLGLVALLRPKWVSGTLPLLLGIVVLVVGVGELISGLLGRDATSRYISAMRRLNGVVSIAVGLVFLLNRRLSLIFVAVALGVGAVILGLVRLGDALHRRAEKMPWHGCAADAGIRLVIGVCMLIYPETSMTVWMIRTGLFFLFIGGSVIWSALFVDKNL